MFSHLWGFGSSVGPHSNWALQLLLALIVLSVSSAMNRNRIALLCEDWVRKGCCAVLCCSLILGNNIEQNHILQTQSTCGNRICLYCRSLTVLVGIPSDAFQCGLKNNCETVWHYIYYSIITFIFGNIYSKS